MAGSLAICKYIISKVEDKNLAINSKNMDNKTPLQLLQLPHQHYMVDYMKSQIEN